MSDPRVERTEENRKKRRQAPTDQLSPQALLPTRVGKREYMTSKSLLWEPLGCRLFLPKHKQAYISSFKNPSVCFWQDKNKYTDSNIATTRKKMMGCFGEIFALHVTRTAAVLRPGAAWEILNSCENHHQGRALRVALLPSSWVGADRLGQVLSVVRTVTRWLLPSGSSDLTFISLNTVILNLFSFAPWPSLWQNMGCTEVRGRKSRTNTDTRYPAVKARERQGGT